MGTDVPHVRERDELTGGRDRAKIRLRDLSSRFPLSPGRTGANQQPWQAAVFVSGLRFSWLRHQADPLPFEFRHVPSKPPTLWGRHGSSSGLKSQGQYRKALTPCLSLTNSR